MSERVINPLHMEGNRVWDVVTTQSPLLESLGGSIYDVTDPWPADIEGAADRTGNAMLYACASVLCMSVQELAGGKPAGFELGAIEKEGVSVIVPPLESWLESDVAEELHGFLGATSQFAIGGELVDEQLVRFRPVQESPSELVIRALHSSSSDILAQR